MSEFSDKLSVLLKQLESGDISPEQFKALSSDLIETVGQGQGSAQVARDPGRQEEIETAAKILRQI